MPSQHVLGELCKGKPGAWQEQLDRDVKHVLACLRGLPQEDSDENNEPLTNFLAFRSAGRPAAT